MTVLVIGGAGFVGLNIVEALLTAGRAVRVYDTAPPPEAAARAFAGLPGTVELQLGDVRDAQGLRAAVAGCSELIYGAAITAGTERDRDAPELTLSVNLTGFLTALEAARDSAVRRVINLSSAGAYGAAAFRGTGPLTETEPCDPESVYSLTKFGSERLGARMAAVWGLDVVSVRLSGVFGRWERGTGVRDTLSPQHQILEAARAGQPALIERADARDWIYAPDVARAVIGLLDADALTHSLYNISTGTTWSVLDWGQAFATAWPGAECRLAEPGESPTISLHSTADRRRLDISRLEAELGPRRCFGFEQSAADYAAWARDL
ncbi:MAG: NAD(P)-dependent oxidoreductase [Pseudomonadota bacterium]